MPSDTALLLTAWRRPRYLRKTLASWAQVPEAKSLRSVTIALGRSEQEREQRIVIGAGGTRMGREITIRPDSDAAAAGPGMHRALGEAIGATFAADPGLEFLICGEEDVIVSDDVLRYMDWARQLRLAHPQILVCEAHNELGQGWHSPDVDDSGADQETVRLTGLFHPWVWGVWRDRWEQVLEPGWDWDANKGSRGFDHGYDWEIGRIMERGAYLAPAPDASRSQNIGRFEGVYFNPAKFALTQAKSFREVRGDVAYRLEVAAGATVTP